MKKLIITTCLLLLAASSAANADKNIEKALENCADDRYVNKTNINDFTTGLYLVQPKFQELEKELKAIKSQQELDGKKFVEEMEKWEKENPKPKQPTYKQLQNKEYSFEQYNKENSIWREKNKKFIDEEIKRLDAGKKDRRQVLNSEINSFIRSQASKYIKLVEDLKSKAKQVGGYLDHFTICEKEYQATPSSFKLKWAE